MDLRSTTESLASQSLSFFAKSLSFCEPLADFNWLWHRPLRKSECARLCFREEQEQQELQLMALTSSAAAVSVGQHHLRQPGQASRQQLLKPTFKSMPGLVTIPFSDDFYQPRSGMVLGWATSLLGRPFAPIFSFDRSYFSNLPFLLSLTFQTIKHFNHPN